MKRFIMMAGMALALSTASCGSTWWANFTNDPVQGVQSFEAVIQVSVTGAQLAWPVVLAALPAASQAAASQQFTLAVSAVNHALQVLNDGVTTAVNLKSSSPNFTTLMQAVGDAVSQVIAIVDQYKTQKTVTAAAGASAPAPVPGYDDMKTSYASLKSFGVKVK